MIDQIETNDGLSLSSASKSFLKETAGWAQFLGIVGFVFLGIMVVAGLFAGSAMSQLSSLGISGIWVTLLYLALALLYFFPSYYLIKFSSNMKEALQFQRQSSLELAFSNLKSFFKFVGILTIIFLALYVVILLFGGLAAAFM